MELSIRTNIKTVPYFSGDIPTGEVRNWDNLKKIIQVFIGLRALREDSTLTLTEVTNASGVAKTTCLRILNNTPGFPKVYEVTDGKVTRTAYYYQLGVIGRIYPRTYRKIKEVKDKLIKEVTIYHGYMPLHVGTDLGIVEFTGNKEGAEFAGHYRVETYLLDTERIVKNVLESNSTFLSTIRKAIVEPLVEGDVDKTIEALDITLSNLAATRYWLDHLTTTEEGKRILGALIRKDPKKIKRTRNV